VRLTEVDISFGHGKCKHKIIVGQQSSWYLVGTAAQGGRVIKNEMADAMRIEKLTLKNFRGIEDLTLDFSSSRTTVLLGVNGAGKSSGLDAIAIMLANEITAISRYAFSPPSANNFDPIASQRWPNPLDIKDGCETGEILVSLNFQNQAADLKLDLKSTSWKSTEATFEDRGTEQFWSQIVRRLRENANSSVPVIIYSPADRRVSAIPLGSPEEYKFDQLTAYDNAISPKTEFLAFFEWYRAREDLENEGLRTDSAHRDNQLEAVRNAVYRMLPPGFTNLRVSRSPMLAMMISKGGQDLNVHQLSDGEKCMLAMVGDIARRLAIANPSLEDPLIGDGVVLIDEIDLHLHPRWQRAVIPGLEGTFPNLQFIVATHSPQVLSTAKEATVYLLFVIAGSIQAKKLQAPYGRDTNTILEELMNVDERPPEVKDRILKYFNTIESGDLVNAEQLRKALASDIGEDDPELVRGAVMTKRKEILGK
jgi:predicted ATP-binding protein involved in virulence